MRYTVEVIKGSVRWYREGTSICHREDGPAIEYTDGTKFWYINNARHRVDGPAIEWANGTKCWYLNGVQLTEEEFSKKINSCDGKVVEIDGKKYKLTEVK